MKRTKALDWDKEIERYTVMVETKRGFLARVVRKMEEMSGREWARQQVREYLKSGGNEPGVRTAMLLLTCCAVIEAEMQKEGDK